MGARPIDRHTDTRHTLRHLLLQGLLIMGATGIVTASLSSWAASNVPATLVNYTCYNAAPAPLTLTDYTQCYSIWQARDGGLHYNHCLNVVGGSMNVFVNNYSTGQFAAYGFVCTHPMGGGGFAIANYSCPDGTPHQEGMCIPQKTYTLTLTPDKATIEPSGTAAGNDKSNTQLIVTIKDANTNLPPDKTVQIRLIAHKPTQGGHGHDDPTRPRGSLAGKECTSDEPCHTVTLSAGVGSASVRYDAPIVSGTHTFTAQCDKCQGDASATLDVKVEGLEPIPASTFFVFGPSSRHGTKNHYLMPAAAEKLLLLAINYQSQVRFKVIDPNTNTMVWPELFRVNDASLEWGGRFDIYGDWTNPHKEHMRGVSVDIRANEGTPHAIPPENFYEFGAMLNEILLTDGLGEESFLECTKDKKDKKGSPPTPKHKRTVVNLCVSVLDGSFDDNRHYHVRLLGVAE